MKNRINTEEKFKKYIKLVAISSMVTAFIGCGKANTLSSQIGSTADLSARVPDMSGLDAKLASADQLIASVDQNLGALNLQDPLNLASDNLKNAVKKFAGIGKEVKAKTAELRTKIEAEIAMLDPSDANQQKIIAKLQEVISYLDKVDAKIDEVVAKIQTKINDIFANLQSKLEQKLSGIQLVLAEIVLGKIKSSVLGSLIGG